MVSGAIFPLAAQENFSDGGGAFSMLRQAWIDADLDVRMSALSVESAERSYALANAGLDPGWQAGLSGDQSAGAVIRESAMGDGLEISLRPSASLAFGDEHQTTAAISAQIIQDGSAPVIISPAVSLGHSIEDLFGADTADPDDLDDLISLYETRLAYRRSLIDSEISLLEQLDSLWTRVLEIEDLEYQARQMDEERDEAIGIYAYPESSSYVANLEARIASNRRQLDFARRSLDAELSYLADTTGILLEAADIETAAFSAADQAPPAGSLLVPEATEFSSYLSQSLQYDLARARLEDFLEADPAQLSLGVSAKGSAADGRLDSADVSGSVGLQLGNSVGGAFALGYQSTGSGYESPYATFTLTFSNDGRRTIEDLELAQLEAARENAELKLRQNLDAAELSRLNFENQVTQAENLLAYSADQLAALALERAETAASVDLGVASQDDLDDIDHEIRQARGEQISAFVAALILQKQIESATLSFATNE
jgi:hypothetical protein